jgi:hypothetical protein
MTNNAAVNMFIHLPWCTCVIFPREYPSVELPWPGECMHLSLVRNVASMLENNLQTHLQDVRAPISPHLH